MELRVRALNHAERNWVIKKVATYLFWREFCKRFQKARLWVKTISAMAAGALAWVRWGEDIWNFFLRHGTG